jgi:hypothetical protein
LRLPGTQSLGRLRRRRAHSGKRRRQTGRCAAGDGRAAAGGGGPGGWGGEPGGRAHGIGSGMGAAAMTQSTPAHGAGAGYQAGAHWAGPGASGAQAQPLGGPGAFGAKHKKFQSHPFFLRRRGVTARAPTERPGCRAESWLRIAAPLLRTSPLTDPPGSGGLCACVRDGCWSRRWASLTLSDGTAFARQFTAPLAACPRGRAPYVPAPAPGVVLLSL